MVLLVGLYRTEYKILLYNLTALENVCSQRTDTKLMTDIKYVTVICVLLIHCSVCGDIISVMNLYIPLKSSNLWTI
jgi:hypothetical protein